jgi:hypothetical protein
MLQNLASIGHSTIKYVIVSAVGYSQRPTYRILASGRRVFGSDDLATTYVPLRTSTHLPNGVVQSAGSWPLLDAHVIYVGLLDGVGSESDCVPTSSAKVTS